VSQSALDDDAVQRAIASLSRLLIRFFLERVEDLPVEQLGLMQQARQFSVCTEAADFLFTKA